MATNFWKGGPGLSSSPAAGSLGRRSRSRSSGSADAYKIPDRWILWVPFQDRGAGEVNRRNFCEALRKGIGTDRRFAPSEGFRKGSDGMASATPHPVSGISELRENRISRTSDSRRADLFLHRPREKPRRGRLPPLSVSHGGNGAPGGARRMRPSASMRNGSAPRSGSRR